MAKATDSPAARSLRARIAQATFAASHDMREVAAKARAGRHQKLLERVDALAGGEVLTQSERERRAKALLKADMARLSLANSQKRAREKRQRAARIAKAREVLGSGDQPERAAV